MASAALRTLVGRGRGRGHGLGHVFGRPPVFHVSSSHGTWIRKALHVLYDVVLLAVVAYVAYSLVTMWFGGYSSALYAITTFRLFKKDAVSTDVVAGLATTLKGLPSSSVAFESVFGAGATARLTRGIDALLAFGDPRDTLLEHYLYFCALRDPVDPTVQFTVLDPSTANLSTKKFVTFSVEPYPVYRLALQKAIGDGTMSTARASGLGGLSTSELMYAMHASEVASGGAVLRKIRSSVALVSEVTAAIEDLEGLLRSRPVQHYLTADDPAARAESEANRTFESVLASAPPEWANTDRTKLARFMNGGGDAGVRGDVANYAAEHPTFARIWCRVADTGAARKAVSWQDCGHVAQATSSATPSFQDSLLGAIGAAASTAGAKLAGDGLYCLDGSHAACVAPCVAGSASQAWMPVEIGGGAFHLLCANPSVYVYADRGGQVRLSTSRPTDDCTWTLDADGARVRSSAAGAMLQVSPGRATLSAQGTSFRGLSTAPGWSDLVRRATHAASTPTPTYADATREQLYSDVLAAHRSLASAEQTASFHRFANAVHQSYLALVVYRAQTTANLEKQYMSHEDLFHEMWIPFFNEFLYSRVLPLAYATFDWFYIYGPCYARFKQLWNYLEGALGRVQGEINHQFGI